MIKIAYQLGVQIALEEAGLEKDAFQFDTDRWQQELAATLPDIAIPAAVGAGVGALHGGLSEEGDAGRSALRGLITGAGAGVGGNIAHRATFEPSFWDWLTKGKPGKFNYPAVAGGAAGGGGLGYLLSRLLVPEKTE